MKKRIVKLLIIFLAFFAISSHDIAYATSKDFNRGYDNSSGSSTEKSDSDSTSETYNKKTISCGTVTDIPEKLPVFCRKLINTLKVLVPVILIILGMIDFFKAASSQDEKNMKESASKFLRRLIISVLIFFIIVIIQFIIKTVVKAQNRSGTTSNPTESILECFSCFTSDETACKKES